MSETDESELESGGFRPRLRPLLVAGALNLVLAGVLLGVPYARGPSRARDVAPRFARFAACLFQGEPLDDPGLGLPRGDRARYASLVIHGPADWPGRCRDALAAIPPEETMFLFPAVKDAEAQVRAAVALVDGELASLQRDREAGRVRVSDRPMRAMARLRSALAELGISASVRALRADRDAIALEGSALEELATPSIVPTRVAQDAPLALRLRDGAMLVGAMDDRTVAHVRVAGGRVDQRLTRRASVVSGMLGAREPPYVVWSTEPAQCRDEPQGCARHATGLAAFLEDRQTLEPRVWLRAHPLGDPARSVHVAGRTAWVLAPSPPAHEVRRFALPEPRVRALGEEMDVPQLAAEARWALEVPPNAERAWIDGTPPALAFAGDGRAGVLSLSEGATPVALEAPAGRVRLAACDGWVAVASERGMRVHDLARGAAHSVDLALRPPAPGTLALACRPSDDGAVRADVVARSDGALVHVRCGPAGCGVPSTLVEEGVEAFDVAAIGGERPALLVAWTIDAEEGPVRVTRLPDGGDAQTAIPAACWTDPPDGLCGAPRLAAEGGAAVLVARDGADLRVLRTEDGRRWSALSGLEQP